MEELDLRGGRGGKGQQSDSGGSLRVGPASGLNVAWQRKGGPSAMAPRMP